MLGHLLSSSQCKLITFTFDKTLEGVTLDQLEGESSPDGAGRLAVSVLGVDVAARGWRC